MLIAVSSLVATNGSIFSTQVERSAELMYESQLLIFITFSTDMGGWYNVFVMFLFCR